MINGSHIMPSEEEIQAAIRKIPDYNTITVFDQRSVPVCYAAGILNGTDAAGTFNGLMVMTRAQATKLLCSLADQNLAADYDP